MMMYWLGITMIRFKSIEKLWKFALWPSNNTWSKIAYFCGVLTNLPVKVQYPDAQKLSEKMSLSLTTCCVAATAHKLINCVSLTWY